MKLQCKSPVWKDIVHLFNITLYLTVKCLYSPLVSASLNVDAFYAC